MQLELVDNVERVVLHDVEVAVVAVARHEVAVLAVPLSVLYAHVLSRNHLAVEQHVLSAILLVVFLYKAKHLLNEVQIVGVIIDLQAQELGSLHESVHTDCEILATHVDVSSVEERQHALSLQFLEVLVVSELHLMAEVYHLREIVGIVESVLNGVLYATVEVDGEHALRAGRHTACTECVAEAVVLNLVAQTAARAERVGIVAHVCEERVTL